MVTVSIGSGIDVFVGFTVGDTVLVGEEDGRGVADVVGGMHGFLRVETLFFPHSGVVGSTVGVTALVVEGFAPIQILNASSRIARKSNKETVNQRRVPVSNLLFCIRLLSPTRHENRRCNPASVFHYYKQ